jgi:hypothetical protein
MLATAPVRSPKRAKQRSRRNAVRHGLTLETVIGALEDAEDYRTFEAAIIADYDALSSVERELVLRLASLLSRIRRATAMETGLFEIQAKHVLEFGNTRARRSIERFFGSPAPNAQHQSGSEHISAKMEAAAAGRMQIPPRPSSLNAFCVSPACPLSRLTVSAVTKPPYGAKQAGPSLRLRLCIAGNHGKGVADCGPSPRRSGDEN